VKRVLGANIFLSLVLSACVERAPELSPADRERLNEYISTERPTPEHPVEVQFENGVELLGYDVDPDTVAPGQEVTLTWHWHAAQDLDDGWNMFTHVAKANGENALNQDGVGLIREMYPPGRWEAGQYIRDVQRVTIPADWGSERAVFYLGLWNGPHRLAIRRGPNDGENRVRAATVPISAAPAPAAAEPAQPPQPPAPPPTPTTIAMRASGAITVDGDPSEEAWTRAIRIPRFVSTMDSTPSPLVASARVLWDDDNLYLAFDVQDDFVSNTLRGRDAHLWEQDAVEIMVDPDGDGANYFEMQVSPTGEVFDTRYDTRRQPQPFGDVAWTSRLRARAVVRGTANDDEADQGYAVEVAIPWAAFAAGDPPAQRPEAGQNWRMNLYVMDKRPDGPQRSAGWSATLEGDFHVPARFGTVRFMGEQQAAAPGAPGSPVQLQMPRPQLNPAAMEAVRRQMAQSPGARQLVVQPQRPPQPSP
jgi:hypothetical protein